LTGQHQSFMVFPRIGGKETSEEDLKDAADWLTGEGAGAVKKEPPKGLLDEAPGLKEGMLKGLKVGILHGKMTPEEKEKVFKDFSDGKTDVLLSTTVIEVGVDVPNSTTMTVFDADRFGLAQLHQLRGRVGRGGLPGYAFFVTKAKPDSPARKRLQALADERDGFRVAEIDKELRRTGDVFGTHQSGRPLRPSLLDLNKDGETIAKAHTEASEILRSDPTLAKHPELARAVHEVDPNGGSHLALRTGQPEEAIRRAVRVRAGGPRPARAARQARVLRRERGAIGQRTARRAGQMETAEFQRARYLRPGNQTHNQSKIDQIIEGRAGGNGEPGLLTGPHLELYRRYRAWEEADKRGIKLDGVERLTPSEKTNLSNAIRDKVSQPLERQANAKRGVNLTNEEVRKWLAAADLGARQERGKPEFEAAKAGTAAFYNPQIKAAKGTPLAQHLTELRDREIAMHEESQLHHEQLMKNRNQEIKHLQEEVQLARRMHGVDRASQQVQQSGGAPTRDWSKRLTTAIQSTQQAPSPEIRAQRQAQVQRILDEIPADVKRKPAYQSLQDRLDRLTQTPATRQLRAEQEAEREALATQQRYRRLQQGAKIAERQVAEGRLGTPQAWRRLGPGRRAVEGDWQRQQRAIDAFQSAVHNPDVEGDPELRAYVRRVEEMLTGGADSKLPVRPRELRAELQDVSKLHRDLAKVRAQALDAFPKQEDRTARAQDVQRLLRHGQFFDDLQKTLAASQEQGFTKDLEDRRVARETELFKQALDEGGAKKAAEHLKSEEAKVTRLENLGHEHLATDGEVRQHANALGYFPEDTFK